MLGNLAEGVAASRELLDRFEQISTAMAEAAPDDLEALLEEQGQVQDRIEAAAAWDLGPNGAGKTTLLRMITGQEKPDSGELRIGSTVELAYVDQSRDALDPERTDLSGGERNRVHLARVLRQGGNVLLLDEPTNDLDVDTLRSLEEALLSFAGSAVVISHDRVVPRSGVHPAPRPNGPTGSATGDSLTRSDNNTASCAPTRARDAGALTTGARRAQPAGACCR